MAIIYTYPIKTTSANRNDLILISDSADKNKTKQISVAKLPGGIDFVGVGGNGTAGKIPKWSTQYDLTDSSISEDSANGNVGIKTSTPLATLDVAGSIRLTGTYIFNSTGSGTVMTLFDDTVGRNNRILLGANASGAFVNSTYSSGGTQNLILNSSGGNVGIGTTNPVAKLEVNGRAKITGANNFITTNRASDTQANYIQFYDNTTAATEAYIGFTSNNKDLKFQNLVSTGTLTFSSGGSIAISVDASQKVGIGNTVPSRKLTVGSGNQVTPALPLTISNGFQSNWVSKLYFGDAKDWYRIAKLPTTAGNGQRGGGILKFSLTGGNTAPTTYVINYWKYYTAFVGSNSHTLKLEQYGPNLAFTKARISLGSDNEVYIEVYKDEEIIFNSPPPIFHDSLLGYDGFQAQVIASDATNTLPSGSSGGSMEELSFVIHGTSVKRLLVNGTINLNNSGNLEIKAAANDAGDIIFKKSDNGQIGRIWSRNDGVEGGLYLATSGITPQLLITDAGNVGIGTTGPTADGLEVANKSGVNGGNTQLFITGNSSGRSVLGLGDDFNNIVQHVISDHTKNSISFHTAATSVTNNERMRITSIGNVGIGTDAPNAKLEVIGETRISFAPSNQYRVRITDTDGNGRILVDGQESALIFGTSAATANATAQEKMRITSAGDVGIGVTGPTQRLDVGGKTRSKGLIIYSTGGVNAGDTNVVFDNTLATKQFSIGSGIVQNTQSGLSIRNVTDSRTDFYINDAGNVAIGTSNPASKLAVDGGDIEVDDSASGLILRSPNGVRHRVKVANDGTLTVTTV